MLSSVCMHGKIRFSKCFSTPPPNAWDFFNGKRFSASVKQRVHKFQTKTSSWSETFTCNFSNKASWFFKLPFPMLRITQLCSEVKSIQIFISWRIFGWKPCSCSNVQPWALTSGPEQPCSGTIPSLPCPQPVHLFFWCMQTAHRECSLVAQGSQVFHKKFPKPDFPCDACSPSKTHKPLCQVPRAVLGA